MRGKWLGSCLFADDIALLARELQAMLDVTAEFVSR